MNPLMKKKFSGPQIEAKLRQADILLCLGKKITEVCKDINISEHTYYRWRKKYGGMSPDMIEERVKYLYAFLEFFKSEQQREYYLRTLSEILSEIPEQETIELKIIERELEHKRRIHKEIVELERKRKDQKLALLFSLVILVIPTPFFIMGAYHGILDEGISYLLWPFTKNWIVFVCIFFGLWWGFTIIVFGVTLRDKRYGAGFESVDPYISKDTKHRWIIFLWNRIIAALGVSLTLPVCFIAAMVIRTCWRGWNELGSVHILSSVWKHIVDFIQLAK